MTPFQKMSETMVPQPVFFGFEPSNLGRQFFRKVSLTWRLGERPELEEAAQELEQRARGWLETDEALHSGQNWGKGVRRLKRI